jgi:Zn-finger nucleic acid-binding protein
MNCPDCKNILKSVECKGIAIQECAKCGGKWFKRDELRRVETKEDDGLRWIDFEPFSKSAEKLGVSPEGKVCPECLKEMGSLTYKESSVVIDKCPVCRGVWLGRGELAKIVLYLKNLVDTASAGELSKGTFKEFFKIFTFHEDVVSEVKDLFAVFYLLELRIALGNPGLANAVQKLYQTAPWL